MSIKENMRWACPNASSSKNNGLRYSTARNLRTIAILPTRSRSQKLTVWGVTDFRKVQLMTRTVAPGVQTPNTGIQSGHCWVHNVRQYDVESKILDKISHRGASTVDKSTTGRFPYHQGTFLKGLQVKICVNRLFAHDRRATLSVFW